MIDIFPEVFDALYNLVIAQYPNANINNELILEPESFPCVCIEEISNAVDTRTVDSGSNERHVNLDYEITVYSNAYEQRRSECRTILKIIDDYLVGVKGFMRIMARPVDMDDGTKSRLIARYTCTTDGKYIYRR